MRSPNLGLTFKNFPDFSVLNQFSLLGISPFSNNRLYWTDGRIPYTTCNRFAITREYVKDHTFEPGRKIQSHDWLSKLWNLKPEKYQAGTGFRTHDPCDTGTVLCQVLFRKSIMTSDYIHFVIVMTYSFYYLQIIHHVKTSKDIRWKCRSNPWIGINVPVRIHKLMAHFWINVPPLG